MKARLLCLVAIALVSAVSLAGCAPAIGSSSSGAGAGNSSAQITLAQVGGLRVIVQVTCPATQDCASASALALMVNALQTRARGGLGVASASAKSLTGTQIEIDLPGYTDQQVATRSLTAQGNLRFIDTGDTPLDIGANVDANQYPVLFTGAQLDPSTLQAQLEQQTGLPSVIFGFKGAAATQFAQYTQSHIGKYLTITLDNVVIESAIIQSEIAGLGQIDTLPTMSDAEALVSDLKSGPLPFSASLVSVQTVSASAV